MKALFFLGLLCGVVSPLWSQDSLVVAQVVPAPGTYEAPVKVEVLAPVGASVSYRFLETPGAVSYPWPESIVLDALPGEVRTYGLRVTTNLASGEAVVKDYRYRVTRKTLPVASVQPEPGRYWASVTMKASLPSGWSARIHGVPATFPLVLDALPGKAETFDFTVSGPLGQVMTWSYTIDRRDQEGQSLELVSPREGTWANPQPLVAVFRGTDRVLWSYGETLDAASAQEYSGPLILDRPGPQAVTLSARARGDGRWLTRTVRWTNGAQVLAGGWPSSGVRVSGLNLPGLPGTTLSWDEGRSWEPGTSALEAASETARKVLSVQVKKDGQIFRYVYWLDARPPQVPAMEFVGGWNPKVNFAGSAEAVHRITWTKADGRSVEEPGLVWGPVGSWKVPDGVVAARLRTTGGNGLEAPSVSLGFAETGWSTPIWEPWDQQGPVAGSQLPLGGRVLPRPGFWPVFAVSDRPDLPEPNADSSLLHGAFLPTFPWGSDRTLYVRFAWRDAGGLVGPGSPAYAVRVDRVPPVAPEIIDQGGQVLVKPADGEEEGLSLLWAVTSHRVSASELITFQPYRAALDIEGLRSGGSGTLWFHAQAQDRAGNLGPARLNVALSPTDLETAVVQVDPNPAVGEIPVESGGVYPWPVFRLRATGQGNALWVGVSDQGAAVPLDWPSRMQPWTGTLSRGVARGERRGFLVYWNAKTASGWAWETPRTLLVTLDLSAPAAPVMMGEWPVAPLGGAWALSLKPGRIGDALRYTFSLDGSPPADPVEAGEPWPGIRAWDAPPGGRVQVRVRVAAVSVSGVALEAPLGSPVVIDRSPPTPVTPSLEPFTYRTAPLVVPLPPGAGQVRYSLATDGPLPAAPTEASAVVPSGGLPLDGRAGETVLYRFWWRPYSLAGVPGPVAGPFSVLIDRTGTSFPVSRTPDDGTIAVPELQGLPVSGLSSHPVTLTAVSTGFLRFEVREGVSEPRPVTAESALWTGPLVLDGGVGVDRSFAVSIRQFSPDGRPMSPESSWTIRVDRSLPSPPSFELNADSRRPEAVLKRGHGGTNPEEILFYRWSWDTFPEGRGTGDWAPLTLPEAVFSAPGGAVTNLRVEAFLRDEAGNSGPTVEKTLLIDQNAVYLVPAGTGDGSRTHPTGLVNAAVDGARREGKSILLVAAGPYQVTKTIDLSGLQVFGGLGSRWESDESGRSAWTAAAGFQGTSLVESADQDWSVSNVDLSTGPTSLSQVIAVRGASVSVRNANWTWAGARKGWSQEGGTVSWTNVGVSYAAENQGEFLGLDSVEATVRGLHLAATQNQGGVLVSLKNTVALFQDLVLVSKNSKGFDGVFSAFQSRLTVDQARVQAGDGAERSTAFLLKATEATLWNTEVSLYGSAANTGYQTTGGHLEVQKGTLSLLRGGEFNQGFVLDSTETVLRSFRLKVDSASYQGGLSVDGGSLTMATSEVVLAGGGQRAWGAQFLSESLVTLEDVDWTLKAKTPGELWEKEKPWAEGSSTQGMRATGW